MATSRTPKRSRLEVLLDEHRQLLAEHEQLRKEHATLLAKTVQHDEELRLTFVRIAQIQAVLDEERHADMMKSVLPSLSKQIEPA